jgi:hypothetical protein
MYLVFFIRFWFLFLNSRISLAGFRVPAGCVCGSCLQRFADLRENTPLQFWRMYLLCFLVFQYDFGFFCVLRVAQQGASVAAACRASPTSEKTRPCNFGACTFCILLIFVFIH